jgi:hypothetical protein
MAVSRQKNFANRRFSGVENDNDDDEDDWRSRKNTCKSVVCVASVPHDLEAP